MDTYDTIRFVRLCGQEPVLYDPSHPNHTSAVHKLEAAERICRDLRVRSLRTVQVLAWFEQLRSRYEEELAKTLREEGYESKLLYFHSMDAYMRPFVQMNVTSAENHDQGSEDEDSTLPGCKSCCNNCPECSRAVLEDKPQEESVELDADIPCDVCRSPYPEDQNEMVFCNSCNVCVHQACYGISVIPKGDWYCRPCERNIEPPSCVLCPKKGGAMKRTTDGKQWAHVSCAWWIKEVSIGCPDRMEPINNISRIPASRWALRCSVCRVKYGACIQCVVPFCTVAYHVTCAFETGLRMDMDETNANDDGVKLVSYCRKHSRKKISGKKRKRTKRNSENSNDAEHHHAPSQTVLPQPQQDFVDTVSSILRNFFHSHPFFGLNKSGDDQNFLGDFSPDQPGASTRSETVERRQNDEKTLRRIYLGLRPLSNADDGIPSLNETIIKETSDIPTVKTPSLNLSRGVKTTTKKLTSDLNLTRRENPAFVTNPTVTQDRLRESLGALSNDTQIEHSVPFSKQLTQAGIRPRDSFGSQQIETKCRDYAACGNQLSKIKGVDQSLTFEESSETPDERRSPFTNQPSELQEQDAPFRSGTSPTQDDHRSPFRNQPSRNQVEHRLHFRNTPSSTHDERHSPVRNLPPVVENEYRSLFFRNCPSPTEEDRLPFRNHSSAIQDKHPSRFKDQPSDTQDERRSPLRNQSSTTHNERRSPTQDEHHSPYRNMPSAANEYRSLSLFSSATQDEDRSPFRNNSSETQDEHPSRFRNQPSDTQDERRSPLRNQPSTTHDERRSHFRNQSSESQERGTPFRKRRSPSQDKHHSPYRNMPSAIENEYRSLFSSPTQDEDRSPFRNNSSTTQDEHISRFRKHPSVTQDQSDATSPNVSYETQESLGSLVTEYKKLSSFDNPPSATEDEPPELPTTKWHEKLSANTVTKSTKQVLREGCGTKRKRTNSVTEDSCDAFSSDDRNEDYHEFGKFMTLFLSHKPPKIARRIHRKIIDLCLETHSSSSSSSSDEN